MDLGSLITAIMASPLLAAILSGGPAIMSILLLIIAALLWDRSRLIKVIEKKDEKIDRIVDDYYKGNITLTEALNSLRTVLYEIKTKI